jgi:hypothetical protein
VTAKLERWRREEFGEYHQALSKQRNKHVPAILIEAKKKQGRRRFVRAPALTYLLLLAAGTRGAAVSGRAAARLCRVRSSCYSKRDNRHQQDYF